MDAPPLALVLCGPTGIGKSQAAMRLAEQRAIEIISVDSAQVYRGLDLGTAKPDAQTRSLVPHHLIDIRDAAEFYSAGEFVHDTGVLVREIAARGRLPVLVGGTMLYFRTLFGGLAALPQANPDIRAAIDAHAAAHGWPANHGRLAALDPRAAARIHPNDAQRIQRALEVYDITGVTMSELQATTAAKPVADFLRIALLPQDRAALHERNRLRFAAMMTAGLLDEVRTLHRRGDLNAASNSVRAVGYRQLWMHLDGQLALAEAVERAHAATRQLVKRQLTWINGDEHWLRLSADDPNRDRLLNHHVDAALKARGRDQTPML